MFHALYGIDWCLVLASTIALAWGIVWFLYLAALIYGKVHLHRPFNKDIEKTCLSGISIAKPLCGSSDPNLEENIKSYFHIDYPEYELLFCVQDETDEKVIAMVNDLMLRYPKIDAQLFIGAQNIGVNPKINNMMNAYDNAKHPIFMISDANIKAEEGLLKDMMSHMTEKVGLVHQLPIVADGELTFSRQLEKVWFGGAHARVYVSANAFGINCMTSMSCMFRKKILDGVGGLSQLSCYIGEDYFLAQKIINEGWRIALCSIPANQNSGLSSVKSFQTRMKRWMYIRMTEMPHMLILEPLQEHIVLGPLSSLAFSYLFQFPIYVTLPAHFISWMLADYLLLQVLENRRCAFSFLAFMKAWIFRELSPLYLYPSAVRMKHISWGGRRYLIRFGGKAELISDNKGESQFM